MKEPSTVVNRSWPVQEALARAAEKLGLGSFLLRLVASELPEHPWLSHVLAHWEGDGVKVRSLHICGPPCSLEPGSCLTALKLEEMVSRSQGRLFAVASLRSVGGDVEVLLRPFAW